MKEGMKEGIIIIIAVIVVFLLVFGLSTLSSRANATEDATLIKEFKYNETNYYMYLDNELYYDGNIKLVFREGLNRRYISTIEMEPTETSAVAIQFFKDELSNELSNELSKDSILNNWKQKQTKVIQHLKEN